MKLSHVYINDISMMDLEADNEANPLYVNRMLVIQAITPSDIKCVCKLRINMLLFAHRYVTFDVYNSSRHIVVSVWHSGPL